MRGNETPGRIVTNFCTSVEVHDVITPANFYDCRLWGLSAVGDQILGFSIDSRRRPYNTVALPCECVMFVFCDDVAVIILCGSDNFVRQFMLAAHRNSMTSGDYVFISLGFYHHHHHHHHHHHVNGDFISLGLLPPDNVQQPWQRHDEDDEEAANAYFALLQVCCR